MRNEKKKTTNNPKYPPQKKISVNVDGYAPASQRLRRELTKAAKIDGWMSFYKEGMLQTAQADIVAVSGVEEAAQPDEDAKAISVSHNEDRSSDDKEESQELC